MSTMITCSTQLLRQAYVKAGEGERKRAVTMDELLAAAQGREIPQSWARRVYQARQRKGGVQ